MTRRRGLPPGWTARGRCGLIAGLLPAAAILLLAMQAQTALRAASASGPSSPPPTLDPARVRWSELVFVARKLIFTATTRVTLQRLGGAASVADLVPFPQESGLMPIGGATDLLTLDTSGLGRRSTARLWLRPQDGAALQRDEIQSGRRHRYRLYRFGQESVYVVTRRPRAGEEGRPHQAWSDERAEFKAFGVEAESASPVAEPAALFYLAGAGPLQEAGDTLQVQVLSRRRVLLAVLTVLGAAVEEVDYDELSSMGERKVQGAVEVLRIRVDARPVNGLADGGDLGFLGLEGDVEIVLERSTRVPVEVRGRAPLLGEVRVKLRSVVLG